VSSPFPVIDQRHRCPSLHHTEPSSLPISDSRFFHQRPNKCPLSSNSCISRLRPRACVTCHSCSRHRHRRFRNGPQVSLLESSMLNSNHPSRWIFLLSTLPATRMHFFEDNVNALQCLRTSLLSPQMSFRRRPSAPCHSFPPTLSHHHYSSGSHLIINERERFIKARIVDDGIFVPNIGRDRGR